MNLPIAANIQTASLECQVMSRLQLAKPFEGGERGGNVPKADIVIERMRISFAIDARMREYGLRF